MIPPTDDRPGNRPHDPRSPPTRRVLAAAAQFCVIRPAILNIAYDDHYARTTCRHGDRQVPEDTGLAIPQPADAGHLQSPWRDDARCDRKFRPAELGTETQGPGGEDGDDFPGQRIPLYWTPTRREYERPDSGTTWTRSLADR